MTKKTVKLNNKKIPPETTVRRRKDKNEQKKQLLMLRAKQVVDGFHWIEGAEGHFNKDCVPV